MKQEDKIDVGSVVKVYFENCPIILSAEVLGVPQDVGDAWKLKDSNTCQIIYVVLYSKMERLR